MNTRVSTKLDRVSMFASVACVLQCLLTPVLLTLTPSLSGTIFDSETFHFLLLFLVIPSSLAAFWVGCRNHRNWRVLIPAILGLTIMLIAAALGVATLGEFGEKGVTIFGALLLAVAHFMNYHLCRQPKAYCNHAA